MSFGNEMGKRREKWMECSDLIVEFNGISGRMQKVDSLSFVKCSKMFHGKRITRASCIDYCYCDENSSLDGYREISSKWNVNRVIIEDYNNAKSWNFEYYLIDALWISIILQHIDDIRDSNSKYK